MSQMNKTNEKKFIYEEIVLTARSGMGILLLNIILMIASVIAFINGIIIVDSSPSEIGGILLIVVGALYSFIIGPIMFAGLKILNS